MSTTSPTCPECGGEIQGITTRGPGDHRILPCDHAATGQLRTLLSTPAIPDGGTILQQAAEQPVGLVATVSLASALAHTTSAEVAYAIQRAMEIRSGMDTPDAPTATEPDPMVVTIGLNEAWHHTRHPEARVWIDCAMDAHEEWMHGGSQ